jgi:purine nucleosidase
MSQALWLDCDPGLDDWLTWLLLERAPGFDLLGVSVTHGNAPLDVCLRNALRIKAHHGLRAPVHAGAAQATAQKMGRASETAQHILGTDGMRTTGAALSQTQLQAEPTNALAAMGVACANHALTLVCTGPLTNVAHLLTQTNARPQRIVLMGGSTDRGNHTPAAEFNTFADPEAASLVFASGVPVSMFGLNLCRQVLLTQAHVREISQLDAVLGGYVDGYQRIRSADGSVPMPLYDPCVALHVLRPELFTLQSAQVDVELKGEFTRGMTVCDFKAANRARNRTAHVQVAMQADGPAALDLMLAQLAQALAP